MRLWSWQLLPYLPDLQFRGQLRELVVIMRDWRDKGRTNHLLINQVMEFPKAHLCWYFELYREEYIKRYNKEISDNRYGKGIKPSIIKEFEDFKQPTTIELKLFSWWHNKEYLRVCMSNLFEKYKFGRGKSRITETEWQRLLEGYKYLTNENYEI